MSEVRSDLYPPPQVVAEAAHVSGMAAYERLVADAEHSAYWDPTGARVRQLEVVGQPDETAGQAVCAFVVLKGARPTGDDARRIASELRNWVAKEIVPIAKPKDIRVGGNLPKTRSGTIVRRLLRSIAKGEAITQDTSTLENPTILDQLSGRN